MEMVCSSHHYGQILKGASQKYANHRDGIYKVKAEELRYNYGWVECRLCKQVMIESEDLRCGGYISMRLKRVLFSQFRILGKSF